jgi:2-methylisocitrate lyase-like PEP mutase family enzyme
MTASHPGQAERAAAFVALHEAPRGFIIPNPWDAGSARLLQALGFKALASTSAGFAFSRARPDNGIERDALMRHLAELSVATPLPVNADLENGFGDAPAECARTIELAAAAGVAGGSIEDSTGRREEPIYPLALAVERVRAAAEAARSRPTRFLLTARCENYLWGRPDLADTIARLLAYQEAGADVLYAPGLASREDIATVLREIDRPLNVLFGVPGMSLTTEELLDMGVQRISTGGTLARAAIAGMLRAATALRDHGRPDYGADATPGAVLNGLFSDPGATL